MKRKFIIFSSLTLFLVIGSLFFITSSKQEKPFPSNVKIYTNETTGENSYLAVDQFVHGNNGSSSTLFETTKDFNNFTFYFNNTTDTSINYGIDGPFRYEDNHGTIQAHEQITLIQNNVPSGKYHIGFTTEDGRVLTGKFQVRVSDQPL